MRQITAYYPDAWFKVEYEIDDGWIDFNCWRIEALDLENIQDSTINATPNITGWVSRCGCMEFEQKDHYCGIHHAEQLYILMRHIFRFAGETYEE
jgi:hypothetical protein